MKRTFSLTSDNFGGEVLFEFRDDVLSKFDIEGAELSEKQHIYIAKYLPRELAEVPKFLGTFKSVKWVETTKEISFEMFWNRYDEKQLSSKKKALAKWQRMTKKEQINAFSYIGKYFASIPQGVRKKYAETYLNSELWNN